MRYTEEGYQTTNPCYFCKWHFLVPLTIGKYRETFVKCCYPCRDIFGDMLK